MASNHDESSAKAAAARMSWDGARLSKGAQAKHPEPNSRRVAGSPHRRCALLKLHLPPKRWPGMEHSPGGGEGHRAHVCDGKAGAGVRVRTALVSRRPAAFRTQKPPSLLVVVLPLLYTHAVQSWERQREGRVSW